MKQSDTPMTLAKTQKIQAAMAKLGFVGDTIFARRPVGGGDNTGLGAEWMDVDTIKENEDEKTPLIYVLSTKEQIGAGGFTHSCSQLEKKLAGAVNGPMVGFLEIWAERPGNQGKSRGEALAAWLSIPPVLAAAEAAFLKFVK